MQFVSCASKRAASVARFPVSSVLRPLLSPVILRSLTNWHHSVRCFASGKKISAAKASAPSVTSQLIMKLEEEKSYEEENYEIPASVEDGPPKGQ